MVAIALVDASLGETPAQRNLERELDARTTAFKVSEGEQPPRPGSTEWRFDAVVVTGSQSSVYDDLDWIDELTTWFHSVHEAGIPTLGICWGHQFIAHALGGTVEDMGEYELGYRDISQSGDDPIFDGIPREFTAFETHSDHVTDLPDRATELARNDQCLQAFRIENSIGVQFHPEYDLETARTVTSKKDLPQERIDSVLDEITPAAYDRAKPAKQVFDNFVSEVGSATATGRPVAESALESE